MTKRDPVTGAKRSRLEQRILHSRYLLLHGLERLTDDSGPHFAGTQVTHFLDLQEIKKRIGLGRGYQSSLFPSCQLTRREPQYAKQICSVVSIHVDNGALPILSEKLLPVASRKWTGTESKQAT